MAKFRRVEAVYEVKVPEAPSAATSVDVWVPFPQSSRQQEIHSVIVDCPLPYTVGHDPGYGNAILHVKATDKQMNDFTLRVTSQLTRYEWTTDFHRFRSVPMQNGTLHFVRQLSENRSIKFSPEVRQIAAQIRQAKDDALAIGRAVYDYVLEHMDYDKTVEGWGEGDSQFACSTGKGNCTDFHSFFLAIIRACGIPGQFEIGMAFPAGTTEGDITFYKCGYHCWASFFVQGVGWVPVDASEAAQKPGLADYYFGNVDENRLLLSTGRDIDMVPRQQGKPENFFTEPRLESDSGQSVMYEKKIAFKDI